MMTERAPGEFFRRRILLLMVSAVIFLVLLAFFVAGYAFFAQERLVESILLSYVQDMVRSLSYELAFEKGHHRESYEEHHFLAAGPSLRGGLVLVLSEDGAIRGASPGAMELSDLPLKEIVDNGDNYLRITHKGEEYIAVWHTVENTLDKVLFLISRQDLLTSAENPYRLLAGILLVLAAGTLGLAWGLWRYLVSPLRKMAADVGALLWGQEAFAPGEAPCVWEVGLLRNVLRRQAETALKNEKLKESHMRDIISVQEEERSRFSRELHDGPLQYVAAAIRRLQIIGALLREMSAGRCGDIGSVAENLSEAEKAAQFSADEIRNLCDEMSPSWLELGFSSALAELTERASRHNKIPVNLITDREARQVELTREKSLALLRLFQEACSNAIRHGEPDKIDVEFSLSSDVVTFSVRDNGKGFDVESIASGNLRARGHRGIAGMRERIHLTGGKLNIISAPGEGCAVIVTLSRPPLNPPISP
ncbi:MAG: sensor histidine kinase [Synergistaceae bacterium]|jgi:signal transduction histidine kinase|nr:sensor histidine kinase [Synergistaceae bacterium]